MPLVYDINARLIDGAYGVAAAREIVDLLVPGQHRVGTPMKLGIYEHYKGKKYKVIGVARHSETLEDMVVYEPLYESISKLWVRPKSMFEEEVEVNGNKIPRFKFLGDSE